jgi:hypothetical protein
MFDGEANARRTELTAEAALRDVEQLVAGHTVLRVSSRNGRLGGSTMTYDPDTAKVPPPTADEIEYTWSGPRRSS